MVGLLNKADQRFATLSNLDMQQCPKMFCNFVQKGLAKNILKIMLGKESNIPKRLLHKCNAVEDGKFSHMKYLEGIDETLILYYILVVNIENISSV